MPAYRSSVFSRTITRSTGCRRSGCARPGRSCTAAPARTGRAPCAAPTLTERKPSPTGVVIGPLIAVAVPADRVDHAVGQRVPAVPVHDVGARPPGRPTGTPRRSPRARAGSPRRSRARCRLRVSGSQDDSRTRLPARWFGCAGRAILARTLGLGRSRRALNGHRRRISHGRQGRTRRRRRRPQQAVLDRRSERRPRLRRVRRRRPRRALLLRGGLLPHAVRRAAHEGAVRQLPRRPLRAPRALRGDRPGGRHAGEPRRADGDAANRRVVRQLRRSRQGLERPRRQPPEGHAPDRQDADDGRALRAPPGRGGADPARPRARARGELPPHADRRAAVARRRPRRSTSR